MKPAGLLLTFLSVSATMIFFRSPTITSAIDLVRGILGFNGVALPQDLFNHLGSVAETLNRIGVTAESWSAQDFVKAALWISALVVVALACPNTIQILARYEPALGVKPQSAKSPIGRIVEWDSSLPWAIVVSTIAAIAIVSIGGPSEFLYWQF
jgi:hypothetical protein